MSSRRRERQRQDAALGHVVTPLRDGGWQHHASCPCGAGSQMVRRAATLRHLPRVQDEHEDGEGP